MCRRHLLLAALMALAACRRGDNAVVLRMTSWQSPEENAIDAPSIREFERRHPGVHVVNDPVSNQAEYREKVITSIASNAAPDVFLLDGIDVPAFLDAGVVLDISRFAPRVGARLADYYPAVLAMFARDDHVYAFPKGFSPIVYYYNRDLFDRAHIPYPQDGWTRDDFVRVARALTRDTDGDGVIDQWGTVLDRHFYQWQAHVWSGGGDILSPDGTRAGGYLDSPQTDSTIRWLTDLPTAFGVAPRPEAFRAVTGVESRLFYSGRLALMSSGHWLIPNIQRYLAQGRLKLGVVSVPRAAGHGTATPLFPSGWAVPRNAPHRKLAVELAAWLGGPDAQRRRVRAGLELPAMPAVEEAFAREDPYGLEPAFMRQVAYGRPNWGSRISRFREVEARMFDVLDRVLIQHQPVHTVTSSVARDLDAVLAR
jgi:multiple sugar transport system substrate-binding protein